MPLEYTASVSGSAPEVSVCVPIYNEEDNVALLHKEIVSALEPMKRSFELVFVDDGSSDRSVARLAEIAQTDPRLVVVRFQRNFGQTAAMMAGIDHARGRYLVTMDGDLQNDPLDIPMMLSKLDEGYDLVVGYRINRQDKFLTRKLPSKIANWLIGKVTGIPIRDNGCSLKVYRAEVIKRVPLYSDMHRFIPAMTTQMGARVAEVGVRHHARRFGVSKYGLSRVFKVLLDLISIKTLQIFTRRPLARFSGAAALSAAMALFAALTMGGPDLVVETAVVGLLVTLAVFLLFLGLVTGAIFQQREP
ncbi:glycosyltransferase family 2 protein [Salipiger sp. 1_MG-2023]|uniref:glycosyltransferase family 2 protein n=1 Tax=Salipiger sp. 1_MG-2023 TaxID=3062665 RepID=UPI0026E39382|nr:glycosyltransferase family 2 protein [Salipiger sp. 1_MG-2023]MDO6587029.1 glycosyltransferase family 2 protein [Salipiger sp. 1_MG-2023]